MTSMLSYVLLLLFLACLYHVKQSYRLINPAIVGSVLLIWTLSGSRIQTLCRVLDLMQVCYVEHRNMADKASMAHNPHRRLGVQTPIRVLQGMTLK